MDILTQHALQDLINVSGQNLVSILMPTHTAGKDKQQDPIRYKNLLKKAADQLQDRGVDTQETDDLLTQARSLLHDPFFWEQQSGGLAVFSAQDMFRSYRLPLPFEETAVISTHFYVKPILPYFANDGHFYIIALSQKQVRLFECTRHTIDAVDTANALPKLAETMRSDQFFDTVQAHTGRKSPQSGEHLVMFHGHDPADAEKKRILGWFHAVDEQLNAYFAGGHAPLVLAGVDSVTRLFKEACAYAHIAPQSISGSPEEMRPGELHNQAWPLVEPIFRQAQQTALERYHSLTSTEQACADVREIVPAAQHGRVETLFVTAREKLWGAIHPETHTIHIHRDPETQDKDLLDWSVIETLNHGGDVHVLESNAMPDHALIAAIYRY